VLSSIGADVTGIGQMALVTIFVIAVLSFLIMPFLPKLPYKIGHLIEVGGELGTVIMISPLYTTLKTLDATLVFVPNVAIMSMTIKNYSHESSRRIEINLSVENGVNLKRAKEALVRLMTEDERVLRESLSPAVFVMSANSEYVDLLGVCWVMNSDWFTTQSDMWEKIVNNVDEDVRLARPRLVG
jgi:small conductance mechanosensitive channel